MGHRVDHVQLDLRKHANEFHTIFEYEYLQLGWKAARLAKAIVCEAFPGLKWPAEMQPSFDNFTDEWKAFQTLVDKSITAPAIAIARGTGAGMLEMTVIKPDISKPLSAESGAVVDVDFAPRLDRFLKPGSELMRQAVTEFLCYTRPYWTSRHCNA